jgi:hypothetical protein
MEENVMKIKTFTVAIALSLAIAVTVQGAGVGFVGAEVDGTAPDWRTSTTPKPYDLDGDDIYGTAGGVHWTVAGKEQGTFWQYYGSGGQYTNAAYPDIDDLALDDGTDTDASITLDYFWFEILWKWDTVRVGVMHDCLAPGEYAEDYGWSASLTQLYDLDGNGNWGEEGEVGESATSSILPGANGEVDMLFFDLTNVQAGDVFVIEGISNDGRTQNPYLGPVSWDAVPEPATMMLLGLGGLTLIRRRRA